MIPLGNTRRGLDGSLNAPGTYLGKYLRTCVHSVHSSSNWVQTDTYHCISEEASTPNISQRRAFHHLLNSHLHLRLPFGATSAQGRHTHEAVVTA